MSDLLDVLVIGAGQAGLAAGYFLRHTNLRFQLVDAAPEIGHVWQTRYDSLRLFTPAKRNALPGLPFPGDPEHYPGKDDVAGYLRAYARTFALPVQLATRVTRLHARDGTFTAVTDRGALRARQVVIAWGRSACRSFHRSRVTSTRAYFSCTPARTAIPRSCLLGGCW